MELKQKELMADLAQPENNIFRNANSAFEYYFNAIMIDGIMRNGTMTLFNQGFYIANPLDNYITCDWRRWTPKYAEREWQWYLSGDRSVEDIKKYAKIWDKMHNGDNIVNSNYGWLWSRNNQLQNCINELRSNPDTRRAYITLYDGKEKADYTYDTPCTLNVGFYILNNKLFMNVSMRSNDLIYGFCNDQYAFSKLHEYVANSLSIGVGHYYHFVVDFHIYSKHFNINKR